MSSTADSVFFLTVVEITTSSNIFVNKVTFTISSLSSEIVTSVISMVEYPTKEKISV